MPKLSSIPQAPFCPDVRVGLSKDKYRLVISRTLWEDRKQRYIPLRAKRSEHGLQVAQKYQIELQQEINGATFDSTLERYKEWCKPKAYRPVNKMNLSQLWDYWCKYQEPLLSAGYYQQKHRGLFLNVIIEIGQYTEVNKNTAIDLRNWLIEHRNRRDSSLFLSELERAYDKAINDGLNTPPNPFYGLSKEVTAIKNRTIEDLPADIAIKEISKRKAFTREERDLIIEYFKKHHPSYYLFVYFRFFTGARFGEAVEVRYKDLTSDNKAILFRRAYSTISGEVKTTKTGKQRRFNLPLELSIKLGNRRKSRNEDDLLFTNKNGIRINYNSFSNLWNGAINALYDDGQIGVKLSLNHTRHTAVTLARLAHSADSVASQLGHSVATQDSHYLDSGDREQVLNI